MTKKHAIIFCTLLVCIYTIIFSFLAIFRYHNFLTSFYDLGVYMAPLFNLTHGYGLIGYNHGVIISYLATHQTYMLYLIGIIYKMFPSAYTLLLLQSFILALGVIPLFLFTKKHTKNRVWKYLIPLCYLLTPTLQWTNVYDFHGVTIATSLLLFGWYFLSEMEYIPAILFLLLAMSCKENVGFIVGGMGIYSAFLNKTKKSIIISTAIAICAFCISLIEFLVLIPYFTPANVSFELTNYAYLGGSMREIISNLFHHPQIFLKGLFTPASEYIYLAKLFLETGFLFLLSPFILVAIPQLFIVLLGPPGYTSIANQYTAIFNALMWISAVYAIARFEKQESIISQKIYRWLPYVLVFCIVLANIWFSPIFRIENAKREFISNPARIAILNKMLTYIPKSASVDATEFIFPHLVTRRNLALYPDICDADYIMYEPNYNNGKANFAHCYAITKQKYVFLFREGQYFVAKKK